MFQSALFVLFAAFPASPVEACASPRTEDPAPAVQDKRPEVAQLVDKLKAHADKRGSEDTEAVGVIDQLNMEFKKSGPKDKAAIIAGIAKCFGEPRLEGKDGVPNDKLYMAAAVALGEMGPDSSDAIQPWIGQKDLRKNLKLQHRLILSLGKTHDKKAVDRLCKLLVDKDATIVSAAAEALGEFAGSDLETRKKAFGELLKTLMTYKGMKDTQNQNTTYRDAYDAVAAPIMTSLKALSKHEEREPEGWQSWWNKNNKGNWDGTK